MPFILALIALLAATLYAIRRRLRLVTPVNQSPTLRVVSPAGGVHTSPVRVEYELLDAESDTCTLDARFSRDGGLTFASAREAAAGGSHGTTMLASSPTGTPHVYSWDAAADLPGGTSSIILQLTPSDARAGVPVISNPFDVQVVSVPANVPPTLRILAPAGGVVAPPVAVSYVLEDREADAAALNVEFSTDAGQTWQPATEGPGSDGTTNLSTSPAGVPHLFTWDALADLAVSTNGVLLRITPSDGTPGGTVRSIPFDDVPRPVTPVVLPPLLPAAQQPEAMIFAPTPNVGPIVPLVFLLSDPQSDPVDLDISFKVGTAPYQRATPAPGSIPITRVPAPSVKTDYRFLWNAGRDVGPRRRLTVTARIAPLKGGGSGKVAETTFDVDTNPFDPLPANTTTPIVARGIEIISGNNQNGIAGQFLPEPLKVLVRDTGNQLLAGAHVSFSIPSTSPAQGTIEEEPTLPMTTGHDGIASVRVRPAKGAAGRLDIVARIAGVDGTAAMLATFTAQVRAGKIIPSPGNRAYPLQYGIRYDLAFFFDGDDDPLTVEFLPDAARPVRWRIEATNAELMWSEVSFRFGGFAANRAVLSITPSTVDQPIVVTITDIDDPAIVFTETLTVVTPMNNHRVTERQPFFRADPLRFRLALESGLDPTTRRSQVGYPGLMLATGYRVSLRDDVLAYTQKLTSGQVGCVSIAPVDLDVVWRASSGKFAENNTPGATLTPSLRVPIGKTVYFVPEGTGPWMFSVDVDADVYDPDARTFNLVDPITGQSYCERENSLRVRLTRAVFVQLPVFEVVDSATQLPVTEPLAAGSVLQLKAKRISPFVSGFTPADCEMEGLRVDASGAPPFSGDVYPFKQRIALQATAPNTLLTRPFIVLRGYPRLPAGAPAIRQSVYPGAWLHFRLAGYEHRVPTAGPGWKRRLIDGAWSLQEAVSGTTPYNGFDGSIQLCSGEMLRSVTDLSFTTRGGSVLFARTYRDHLLGSGMLGPGWILLHEAMADTSRPWGTTLLDGHGRLFDVVNARLPDGLYITITRHYTLDADHGTVEVKDRFGTSAHYHIDGTLKFIEDTNGNRTSFTWNERAQLIELKDPLGRICTFEYYPANATPVEIRGRLFKIKDFDNREVEFEYYTANTNDGRKGWLRKVSRPEAETIVNGALKPAYRRGEQYKYVISLMPVLDGALREILNSENQLLALTQYTAQRRVEKQTFGGGSVEVVYRPGPPREVDITDRANHKITWTFKSSPMPDAATPVKAVETSNRVRPNPRDSITLMEHSIHGEVISVTFPGGGAQKYVYDDGSIYPRSRGNLLVSEEVSAQGSSRYVTYSYDQRFNRVSQVITPDGHRLNLPRYLRTEFIYDVDGNLTEVNSSRSVYGTLVTNALGNDEIRWIHDQHRCRYTYNGLGLVKTIEDPQGVVTAFGYYPEATPEGSATMATSPDAGGFLGSITRDAQNTTQRNRFFPGVTLEELKTSLTYDKRGDIRTHTDEYGVITGYRCNSLRQVRAIVHNQPAGTGTAVGPVMTEYLRYDVNGLLVQRAVAQGTAAASTALTTSDVRRDADGDEVETRSNWESGATPTQLVQSVKRDGAGLIEEVYAPASVPAGATAPATPLVKIVRDERGLPFQRIMTPGADPMTYTFKFTADGDPERLSGPAGEWMSASHDEFGGVLSLSDFGENEMFSLANEADERTRIGLRTGAGPSQRPLGFQEIYLNEHGDLRRVHNSVFPLYSPGGGGSFPVPPASEAFPAPAAGTSWPPLNASALEDKGKWCAGDGRESAETLRDPLGRLVRFVDDENRVLYVGRRPDGSYSRALDNGSWMVQHRPDSRGDTETIEIEELSTDPLRPSPRTMIWKAARDRFGRPNAIIDGLGNVLRAEYDVWGDIEVVTDPNGFDSTDPNDAINGHRYNLNGNSTRYTRDNLGRLRRILTEMTIDGIGGNPADPNAFNPFHQVARSFDYDAAGRLNRITDTAGETIEWSFEDRQGGRCTAFSYQGQASSYTYDAQGRLESWTDANGTKVKLEYDAKNRVQKVSVETLGTGVQGVSGYTFTYDDLDHLASATEINRGYVAEFGWDFVGNLREEKQRGLPVRCDYNGAGQRRTLSYPPGPLPVGPAVTAIHDLNKRLRRLELQPAAPGPRLVIAEYEYIGRNSLLNRTTGPVKLEFEYDEAGRLKRQWLASNTIEFETEPRRDGRFRKWTRRSGNATETREWKYDSVGRVIHEDAVFASARTPQRRTIDRFFDADGTLRREHRREITGGSNVATVLQQDRGAGGRITSRNGIQVHYDANGNLARFAMFGYFYDFLDRLVQLKDFDTGVDTFYDYDALGRCTARSRGGVLERYIYDGWHIIEVRIGQGEDERIEHYYYGRAINELIRAEIDGQIRYFVPAPDGSIDSLLDANGGIIESYDYDLNGNVTVLDRNRQPVTVVNASGVRVPAAPQCRFGFHGHMYDPVTKLLYVKHRYYQPELGQFLTADRLNIVRATSMYAFAGSDAVNMTDYFGFEESFIDWREAPLEFVKPIGAVILVAIGLGVLCALFPPLIPFVAPLGIAMLAGATAYYASSRWDAGQGAFASMHGGLCDTFGITALSMGFFQGDPATGEFVPLTPQQRGRCVGGGFGTMTSFVVAGRPFGWGQAGGRMIRRQFMIQPDTVATGGTAMVLKAAKDPRATGHRFTRPSNIGPEEIEYYGRPRTLDEFMDAIQARLHSMPRPGPREAFRESAILRLRTYDAEGNPRSSDLVFQTPPTGAQTEFIPRAVESPSWRGANRLLRAYPELRVSGRMHTHPPTFSTTSGLVDLPGHSYGDIGMLGRHLRTPFMRRGRDFSLYVIRIGRNGAPEEVGYITLSPEIPGAAASTTVPPAPLPRNGPPYLLAAPADDNR